MKKQGFTLIELMVVIVIMGILAAVAVPKLFGMIAKSKASEVGPAAGTYVKLQDAYVAETGAYYGQFATIGYEVPGTKSSDNTVGTTSNFKFEQQGSYDATQGTASLTASSELVWQATNLLKLNDCGGNNANWKLYIKGGTGGQYGWENEMGTNCDVLTPSFKNFGTVKTAP